ncbi:barstar family protein [Rhodococcus sp. AG1013]|uniref:barstar family protein n=1 Tax=Rhodococcus sp. AG1013 TaxID=2183996 RepID=UPI00215DB598|nr:barstar family protein [Rhodococcus sp. AG1013]
MVDAMTLERGVGSAVEYVMDGTRIHRLENVFLVVGEAVRGAGGYFGTNLDSFSDCLTGGYGTPDDGNFYFVWESSERSWESLGCSEAVRQLDSRLETCHRTNRSKVRAQLDRALAGAGPTAFDWVVNILAFRRVRLDLR